MRKLILFFGLLITFSFLKDNYNYKFIDIGECLVVTSDNNEGGVDWHPSGEKIVFSSPCSGTQNIYYLDLLNLKYSPVIEGYYTANYINDFIDNREIYISLTDSKDTSYSEPKWSASGNKILSIGSYSGNNEVFCTNRTTLKTVGTGIKNISATNWKSLDELYIVKKEELRNLYLTSLNDKTDALILTAPENILGISKQKGILYLACNGGVLEYKTETKKQKWFKMNINGKTAWKLNRLNFIVKNKNGQAQIMDLNNGVGKALFIGNEDGAPALSSSNNFVAFYSKFLNGIVIKKLKRKY